MNHELTIKEFEYKFFRQILTVIFFSSLFVVTRVQAAGFSFSSPAKIGVSQEFQVDVKVNTQMEQVNALEGKITYDAKLLSLEEVREAGTVISLWAKDPAQNKSAGAIEFSGITPGGFNTADQPKNIFSLVFKTRDQGNVTITGQNFIALRNDGQGTSAQVSEPPAATIRIDADVLSSSPVSIIEDQDPPESPFIQIIQDPSIEEGKWVAVFYGQDKKSGINHYEIAEQTGKKVSDYNKLSWKIAQSPYLLSDQSRRSVVYLKAVDNKGNQTVVTVSPAASQLYKNVWFWCIIVLSLFVYLGGKLWHRKNHSMLRR